MSNTDWHDIVNEDGYVDATFCAQLLADDLATVVDGAATITVTASAGELDGIAVAFMHAHTYADMWFEIDDAHTYATVLLAASAASAATSTHLTAWSCAAMPDLEPVDAQIATDPDDVDGIYLHIDEDEHPVAVLISQPDAAQLAHAIRAAAMALGHTAAELVDQERRTDEERVQGWMEIGQRNPWIRQAWDPPFNRESFTRCDTVDELRQELGRVAWCVGTAFHYRDLCLINQVDGGDEWLTIRHGIAFESITFAGYIEHGGFESLINRLLAATKEQCEQLTY